MAIITPITQQFASQRVDNVQPSTTTSATVVNQPQGFPVNQSLDPADPDFTPVTEQEMNGTLNYYTNLLFLQGQGGQYTFDATLSTAINGYPQGAILYCASNNSFQRSLINNNTANFITTPSYINDGVHWVNMPYPDITNSTSGIINMVKPGGGNTTVNVIGNVNVSNTAGLQNQIQISNSNSQVARLTQSMDSNNLPNEFVGVNWGSNKSGYINFFTANPGNGNFIGQELTVTKGDGSFARLIYTPSGSNLNYTGYFVALQNFLSNTKINGQIGLIPNITNGGITCFMSSYNISNQSTALNLDVARRPYITTSATLSAISNNDLPLWNDVTSYLSSQLNNYVTNSSLASQLANYIPKSQSSTLTFSGTVSGTYSINVVVNKIINSNNNYNFTLSGTSNINVVGPTTILIPTNLLGLNVIGNSYSGPALLYDGLGAICNWDKTNPSFIILSIRSGSAIVLFSLSGVSSI